MARAIGGSGVPALGINLTRLRLFVFALGTALAAIAHCASVRMICERSGTQNSQNRCTVSAATRPGCAAIRRAPAPLRTAAVISTDVPMMAIRVPTRWVMLLKRSP